jgi:tetratricopeptide (TPR) repeat protein
MQEAKSKRPTGIAILSWLHMGGGAIGAVIVLVLLTAIPDAQKALDALTTIGLPPGLLLCAIIFLLILTCLSGVGMWTGIKWGWFLGSFYYAYSITRNLNALITIPAILGALSPEELSEMPHGPGFYYAKHGLRVVVHGLLYLYFFKTNVRAHFSLQASRRWVPAVTQVGICIAIASAFSLTARITTPSEPLTSEIRVLEELFNKGEYDKVVVHAKACLREHPGSHLAWAQLGWARTKLDQPEEARTCFFKALELEPTWDNAYVGLGVLCRKQGDLTGARTNYLKAISIAPPECGSLLELGHH